MQRTSKKDCLLKIILLSQVIQILYSLQSSCVCNDNQYITVYGPHIETDGLIGLAESYKILFCVTISNFIIKMCYLLLTHFTSFVTGRAKLF
jgi:hypothetical protein